MRATIRIMAGALLALWGGGNLSSAQTSPQPAAPAPGTPTTAEPPMSTPAPMVPSPAPPNQAPVYPGTPPAYPYSAPAYPAYQAAPTIVAPPVQNPPSHLGLPRQVALSSDFVIESRRYSQGGTSGQHIVIRPSLDYFVGPGFSLGGAVGISYDKYPGSSASTQLTIGGRLGYDVRLSDSLSWWLMGGLDIGSWSGGSTTSGSTVSVMGFAPFLWEPAPHFFIGIGPNVSTELVSKYTTAGSSSSGDAPKYTQYGLQSMIGGYFGGP